MLNILIAYPYMNAKAVNIINANKSNIRFLLDSGAFTAFRTGKKILLDDYCGFLDSLPFEPWHYFMLDVIHNPDATIKNLETMISRGYKPVPVFTLGQDLSVIDEYYKNSEVIACGGIAGAKSAKSTLKYLHDVMKKCNGRKVHLLGYSQPKYVKFFKPYSCDSTSWNRSGRFGQCDVYIGQGEYKPIRREYLINKPDPKIVRAVNRLGFSINDLTKRDDYKSQRSASKLSVRSWLSVAEDFEKNANTRVFFATGPNDLEFIIRENEEWQKLKA